MRPSLTFWIGIAALSLVLLYTYTRRSHSHGAPISASKTRLATLRTALDAFDVDVGHFPIGKAGLLDLLRQPPGETNWRGPYLDSDGVPKDPWNNDFIYDCPGSHNTNSFDLISCGPDGLPGTRDDIANWTNN